MADLYIPDLPEDCDVIQAALAYAAAGWYVLPIRPNARKNPGSVVGKAWHHQSTRDVETIVGWFAGSDYGVALHLGRSGALAFDVDYPDKVPSELAHELEACDPPMQTTRIGGDPGRGHYVFAMPAGRMLGNSTGQLGGAWGEIRGKNGIIVVAPSLHDEEAGGGFYQWQDTGPLPVLPGAIGELLPDAGDATDAASDAEVAAFLGAHTGTDRPELAGGWVTIFKAKVAAGESRHERMVKVATGAMKEARTGYFPARHAAELLLVAFVEAVGNDPIPGSQQRAARKGGMAASEWAGILAWAVAQAQDADLAAVRARVAEKMPQADQPPSGVDPKTGEILDIPAVTTLGDDGPGKVYDWFWQQRTILTHVHEFARARRVSPWAVLGVVLVRVCAVVPPFVVLPALVGSHVSLNTYIGFVGRSGAGKDSAINAAADAVDVGAVTIVGIGSGEGIAHQYVSYKRPDRQTGDPGGLEQHTTSVVFDAPEVDTLAALKNRQSSTLLPELRKAWTGSPLGFAYVDKEKRLKLPAHAYRLGLIVAIQPERAAPLLDDTDSGTPQRLLWLPAVDGDAPDVRPDEPEPIVWRISAWPMASASGRVILGVCRTARDAIDSARLARLRGDGDALDGHGLLCRLKVASLLGILDGRAEVNDDDWTLAGVIQAKSDYTRGQVVQALKDARRDAEHARGKQQADRAVMEVEAVEDAAVQRVARAVRRKLVPEWATRSDLRRGIAGRDRGYFDLAIDRLAEAGQIEREESDRGARYRLAERADS